MNPTLKCVLKKSLPSLAFSLFSSSIYASSDCTNNATLVNPSYDLNSNTIHLPLVKILDTFFEKSSFMEAKLHLTAGTGLFGFTLSQVEPLSENCPYVNPIAVFNPSNNTLDLPIFQVLAPEITDTALFYHAQFNWDEATGNFILAGIGEPKFSGVYGSGKHHFSLATASPGELGLLEVLAETFAIKENATVYWRKAGSGTSLKLLKNQSVDMAMVHAPDAEEQAISEGWATNHSLIGSNEFYIVGPTSDPANIAVATSAKEAYTRIANVQAKFLSRGDNSGTHKREMSIWDSANISPEGNWYIVTHDFMTATLRQANEESGYFMTDSSTWVVERQNLPNLTLLFHGDPVLVNVYHALTAPKGDTMGQTWAAKFVKFVGSKQGQQIISEYGQSEYGEALYNDAHYAKRYDK